MKQKRMWLACVAAISAAALSLTGCGSSGSGSDSDSNADGGRGPITFASGKDFTQEMQNRIDV